MLSSCPEPCVALHPEEAKPASSELALDEVNWPFLRCILKIATQDILKYRILTSSWEKHTRLVNEVKDIKKYMAWQP